MSASTTPTDDIVKMWRQFSLLCILSINIFSSFTSAQVLIDLAVTNAVSLSDANVFKEGVPFKLTCSADMVNVPSEINIITSVQIKQQLPGSSTMEIAFWKPNNEFGGPIQRENTMSRSWSIEFSGSPPVTGEATYSNRATKAELTMNDVKCSDAGVYECSVVYDTAEGVSTILSGQQNISSQAEIKAFRVWVDPSNQGFQYKDGDNVMIWCYAEGPENLQMSWRYSAPLTPNVFRPYLSVNNDPPELLANSECGAIKYRSSFKLTLQEEENGYMYVCAVRHGNEMEHTRNITLSISAAQTESLEDIKVTNAVSLSHTDVFKEGVPFQLTCSADMVNVPPEIDIITSVQINRQLSGSPAMEIAFWSPNKFTGPVQREKTMSRSWTIEFSGSPPVTDPATYSNRAMKAELTINDVKSSDAGVYECVVVYDSALGVATILSGQQNIPSQDVGSAVSGRSGNDAGIIVGGIVIGVLAFIIIVLLIVFFCWYRQRNKSSKDPKNVDTRQDMHLSPPVIHSNYQNITRMIGEASVGMTNTTLDTSVDVISPSLYATIDEENAYATIND